MNDTLTAAGIKLCVALGLLHPTVEQCNRAIESIQPPGDGNFRSPILIESNYDPKEIPEGFTGCIVYETFERYDKSIGSSKICWRKETKLIFVPEAGRRYRDFGQ